MKNDRRRKTPHAGKESVPFKTAFAFVAAAVLNLWRFAFAFTRAGFWRKRPYVGKRSAPFRVAFVSVVMIVPQLWGFAFGFARGDISWLYAAMAGVSGPVGDALAPWFPAIDNLFAELHARGYGARADFARHAAAMTALFMTASFCFCAASFLAYYFRSGKFTYVKLALRNILAIWILPLAWALFGWAAHQFIAGVMLVDFDPPSNSRNASLLAIYRHDAAAGFMMSTGAGIGFLMASCFVMTLLNAPIVFSIAWKRHRRRQASPQVTK